VSTERVDVLVIGSGAGGAVTALELASAGRGVCVLEEGARHELAQYGAGSVEAMQRLYRRRGMTPITGRVPIGYVEGACLGGSTEINSGFWHRTPREVLLRYKSQFDLQNASPEELDPHFEWAEERLHVSLRGSAWPKSTQVFSRGIEAMGWSGQEVPRAASGCEDTNTCATGCPKGAKQGMSRAVLPDAERAGARILTGCRARMLLTSKRRVTGVLAEIEHAAGAREMIRIDADHVFVNLWEGPIGRPLSYASVDKLVARTRRRVGFHFTAHQFRHTYATLAYRDGVALEVIGAVLTHRSPTSTLVYAHPTAEDLRRALDERGVLDRVRDLIT